MKLLNISACRPYLLRAYYEWLTDNQLTPHLVVDATHLGIKVPLEYVENGKIILNIAAQAVANFQLDHDTVSFSACFKEIPHKIVVPISAVLGIYARENGAGTLFDDEPAYAIKSQKPEVRSQNSASPEQFSGRPSLRIVE